MHKNKNNNFKIMVTYSENMKSSQDIKKFLSNWINDVLKYAEQNNFTNNENHTIIKT